MSKKTEIPRLEKCFTRSIKGFNAKDPNHGSSILKSLHKLYKDQRYCDVTLNIGDERKLPAHRVVLASFSSYFEARLGSNWEEGRQDEVELLGFDESVVSSLIEFAYSGNIDISTDNVQTLLEAANYLGVEFVQNSCAEFLKKAIDDKTCLAILQFADIFALDELKNVAKQYALRHFVGVCNEEGFLNLPYDLLVELLGDDDLCVVIEGLIPHVEEREKIVLQRVFQYVEHDLKSRREHLPELLSLVRLPTLSVTHLQDLSKHELVASRFTEVFDKAQKLKKRGYGSKWLKPRPPGKDVLFWGYPCARRDIYREVSRFPKNVNKIEKKLREDFHVKGMKLWIRRVDGSPELSGLKVFYSDNSEVMCEVMSGCDAAPEHHEFHLEEDEKIVGADVEFNNYTIMNLTFYSNKRDACGMQTEYGPYGDKTMGEFLINSEPPWTFTHLVEVAGAVITTQAGLSITRLQFAWKQFVFRGDPVPRKYRCKTAGFADYTDDEADESDEEVDEDDDDYDDYNYNEDDDDDDDNVPRCLPVQPCMDKPLA